MDDIRLERAEPVKPKLPHDIKILNFGDLTIICRWNGFSWRQVSDTEAREILRDFDFEYE